jgi:hypothetical protein
MPDPVVIDVDNTVEGVGLVQCLSRHGLIAGLVRTGSRWQVEVRSLGEDPRSFFADLGIALAAWSGSRERDSGRAVRRVRV